MNPNIAVPKDICHECTLKDKIFNNREDMINDKDCLIVERNVTIKGLMETIKKMTKERTGILKKAKETDSLKKTISEKNKETSNMKVAIVTKDGPLAEVRAQAYTCRTDIEIDNSNEVTVEAEVKKCQKCIFTAPNIQILGLHMENDHQYQFDCNECNKKFPFKNQLKMHKRENHEEGTFACFVCSSKFKSHQELKQHIQKRCKTQNNSSTVKIVHKHNEDINKEDEHKCPKCPKITNNQVSLVNHMNTMHSIKAEKCDSCGQEFQSREELIKHIVDTHTKQGTAVIPRHICKVCNIEVHGDINRDNHICRKPQWCCDWCKEEFYSSEARKTHICQQHRFKTVDEQLNARRRSNIECSNGPECWRASLGKCWFKHSQRVNILSQQQQGQQQQGHQGRQGNQGRQGQQSHGQREQQEQEGQGQDWQFQQRHGRRGQRQQGQGQLYCRFQERCFKGEFCKYKHFEQNFQINSQSQNNQ